MTNDTSVQPRRVRDVRSVVALRDLLLAVLASCDTYASDLDLRAALRSQAGLANYRHAQRRIVSMSLNHQKLVAQEALGSFEELDDLRREAIEALNTMHTKGRVRKHSKDALTEEIRSLKTENQILKEDLFLLQRAYDLRCLQARQYAQASGALTHDLCSKEQRESDVTLSMRRGPVPSGNVSSIRDANLGRL